MNKQKVGLILFWFGAVWAVLWGILGSVGVATAYRASTVEEVSQTMWALGGFWQLLWAFSPPLGMLIAGVGVMLFAGARGSAAGTLGIGIFVAAFLALTLTSVGHLPPLFGIGGSLILLSFMGTLWFWAKERVGLEGAMATAANLRLAAYVFFALAAWFICGIASQPFLRVFEGVPPDSPIHAMTLLVLGWLCLFLSHYKSGQQRVSEGA